MMPEKECSGKCAIQARISAEDPWENFRPAPARVDDLRLPGGPWLRTDFGVETVVSDLDTDPWTVHAAAPAMDDKEPRP